MDLSLLHPFWAIGLPVAGSMPLGWWMARALDPPAERVGKGIDAVPLGPAQTARPPRAGPDGLEAVRLRALDVQRGALRALVRDPALAEPLAALEPRRQGLADRARLQGHRGSRAPRGRHGRDLQHRLLVRDQHQPAALFGRAASLVLQPARRDRVAPVRHAGLRVGRDAGGDPRPARRARAGRFLPRHDPRAAASCWCRCRSLVAVAAGGDRRADDAAWSGRGPHARARHADDRRRARRRRGRHQAAWHQRRRLLRAQLGASLREPQPVEQPARGDLDHHRADGVDRHVRPA